MRVAFIVWQFPVLSETFILNQIVGLLECGHEVDIYANQVGDTSKTHPDVEKYYLIERTYYIPQFPKNYFWRCLKGLGLICVHGAKNPLLILRSLNVFKYGKDAASLWLLYLVIPFLEKKQYDIIHCQFGTDGIKGMLLRSVGAVKGKLVTTFRGYDISYCIQKSGQHVYDRLFETGDFFLSNCEFFKRRAIALGCDEKRIVVHGSGIDCSRFTFTPRYPHRDGIVRIATTGRLVEKKGIEYSIRAVAQLAKDYPIEYNIIGDGPLREQLQQLIHDLGVSNIVKLLGEKQQEELIEILKNCHIFTAPSVTAADGNQDAPVNVLKEAMAIGLPVVSTYHGGIPELVEDGISGCLVPERDVDALAEKLGYLIEHPEIWSQMGRAGRAYVEAHYNIHKLNEQLIKIYQQLTLEGYQTQLQQIPVGAVKGAPLRHM